MSNLVGIYAITVIIGKTKKKLKEAGATSEETAKTPEELGLKEKWLKTSRKSGVVETKDGRYYLSSNKE
ncbi:MAG TPA: hypothetical protein VFF30_04865 [Nitrososphaerales archaeon]|nr:hypothetical protein [Nitrososphaerales archaeon]